MNDELSAAEVLAAIPKAVLSHQTAARLHRLDLLEDTEDDWITVPRGQSHHRVAGWRIHRADLGSGEQVIRSDGLRVTSVVRTVGDLARQLALGQAVAVADSALHHRRTSREPLATALMSARGRGAAGPRAVARLMDGRSESVLESALRVLLVTSTLPLPVLQHVIAGTRGQGIRVDFCWPERRLVVEADGFAFHSDRAAYRRDRERMNELERLGWRVLRFTYEDIIGKPATVLALVAECLGQRAAA